MNIFKHSLSVIRHAALSLALLTAAFLVFEPAIGFGATATSQFTISQQVTSEISFATPASNVVMSPALGGITGGTANGHTTVVVTTNSLTGYSMTIQASSSLGMIGNASSTNYIPAYAVAATGTPDFAFTVPANAARFGYTVDASTTTDVDPRFHYNGSNICNQTTADSVDGQHCWIAATTTQLQIVNRTIPTLSTGATTSLYFRVQIASNPSPALPNDTYVATTTLTATAS